MKRLLPKDQPSGNPVQPVFKTEKERLIQDIRDYIGTDGYAPMEHGYKPSLNAIGFDYDGMDLRHQIGKEHRRRIEYSQMDEKMLTEVIINLFRYSNYCRLHA